MTRSGTEPLTLLMWTKYGPAVSALRLPPFAIMSYSRPMFKAATLHRFAQSMGSSLTAETDVELQRMWHSSHRCT